MRVIAGEFRSRVLKTLPGMATRPTPDRMRETLFNVLAPRMQSTAVFVDAYAGTGAVGIEALSRGAERVVFIERSRSAVAVIRQNLRALGLEGRAEVVHGKVLAHLGQHLGDIVFLDPPYDAGKEYAAALGMLGLDAPPLAILQHSVRMRLMPGYGALVRQRELVQGDNVLSFYERAPR